MAVEVGEDQKNLVSTLEEPTDVIEYIREVEKVDSQIFNPVFYRNQETYTHLAHTMHLFWLWAKTGRNVINLTHSLAAALMLTDPPKMAEGEALKLPWPAFAISVPSGIVPVLHHDKQEWADLIWVYSYIGRHRRLGESIPFFRWMVERKSMQVWRDRYPYSIEEPEDEIVYSLFPGEAVPGKEDDLSLTAALRLIRNLCSWIEAMGSLSGDAAPSKKKKKGKRKAAFPRPRTWNLGEGFKLRPELRAMASEVALGRTKYAPEGWSVRVRHIVSGHWKMQMYGKSGSLRKRIWVKPYWRGPEGQESWKHLTSE